MVEKKKVYDVVIVGGGPAAISSAIYLARRNLCVLMVYGVLGGQASTTADIENYVGFIEENEREHRNRWENLFGHTPTRRRFCQSWHKSSKTCNCPAQGDL